MLNYVFPDSKTVTKIPVCKIPKKNLCLVTLCLLLLLLLFYVENTPSIEYKQYNIKVGVEKLDGVIAVYKDTSVY